MIALDAALRRLTVCQLTRESHGNGGGLRPRLWLCLRAAAWGQLDPGWNLTIGRRSQFLLVLGHMKRTGNTLYRVVFQKLNGPLLTSIPGADRSSTPLRELIRERTGEGRRRAMAAGVPLRPKVMTNFQAAEAVRRRANGSP